VYSIALALASGLISILVLTRNKINTCRSMWFYVRHEF
jgi:hypothetical protein